MTTNISVASELIQASVRLIQRAIVLLNEHQGDQEKATEEQSSAKPAKPAK